MDVNAFFSTDPEINEEFGKQIDENAALNVKRIVHDRVEEWADYEEDPYLITKFQEIKTTWHPVGF